MKKHIWWLAGLGAVIIGVFVYIFWLSPVTFGSKTTKQFIVQSGDGIGVIARNLQEEDLIRSDAAFKTYLKATGQIIVQPGIYTLSKGWSVMRIANFIAGGITSNVNITIPEGWTSQQIARAAFKAEVVENDDELLEIINKFPPDYDFLKVRPANASLEGFLFPDTYRFIKGNPTLLVRQILENFSSKYNSDIKPKLNGKNLYDILIIASMIEREAQIDEDRYLISGVITNRLAIGMRLDIDATVRYIIDDWENPLTRDDLSIDSPYNTRRYGGLPPGPICNPGLASIKAAISPAEHDYYYYLTDLTGVTHYAKTVTEHNANKVKYLL
ncbi:MAG: endolytic transglycosylase MltG [Patescibacteria group bacterium]|nr:endolytic transglycosylase MltG [Patescibacteria group bacterium]